MYLDQGIRKPPFILRILHDIKSQLPDEASSRSARHMQICRSKLIINSNIFTLESFGYLEHVQ